MHGVCVCVCVGGWLVGCNNMNEQGNHWKVDRAKAKHSARSQEINSLKNSSCRRIEFNSSRFRNQKDNQIQSNLIEI